MESHRVKDINVTLNKEGSKAFAKVNYPIRYGRYGEIETRDHIFQFNLKGEIKYIQGKNANWPNPIEWLKRTVGNDWTYYFSGGYNGLFDTYGEYYIPLLSYPSNSILMSNPFKDNAIKGAINSWKKLVKTIRALPKGTLPENVKDFLYLVSISDSCALEARTQRLYGLIGGRPTVLPPDTRHVDYEVIPIIVADGCLYKCPFCVVKSGKDFHPRTKVDILNQIVGLKALYGDNLKNYSALFLGQHDALYAGKELLEFTALKAYEILELNKSFMKEPRLFIFGSPDSLVASGDIIFDSLNKLPYETYLNIGLESFDPDTLKRLQKPVDISIVTCAFERMLEINRRYEKIEVSANIVFGNELPANHFHSFIKFVLERRDRFHGKGIFYLSPLINGNPISREERRVLYRKFKEWKFKSRLPVFIYLIQRL
jgi:hypothetical protein